MSIMVITETAGSDADALALVTRARAAGQTLVWRVCDSVRAVTECVRSSRGEGAELVLLDMDVPEDGDAAGASLTDALGELPVPFIEIHDRDGEGSHPAMVTVVVPGDREAGVDMALSIALRYLAGHERMAA
ncbi:hypothetical protein EC912_10565 [Luteibacter rhizovicinus]|uniref:3-dehydroquinate dehydratase n=1 Tax=Luteibacter rhizovicinus TaxID=242606 RepID=A0A4R3YKF0_9GAMM|nr:hypothetical protein [Luteibacter rhizovicinus]TCV93205.1 hypothetical protein EC912_10565 [Luteibacter rhizovicinus]